MGSQEKYLKPEVIQQVKRLDLRAKFIVEGFLTGLHKSPYHGFSAEFSEHRKYEPGDDIGAIDWSVFARTDKYFIKKFEAETNLTGYLVMDLSGSMDYTYAGTLTKLEYATCVAASLAYLMIQQSDSVGLVTFADRVQSSLAPSSRRGQLPRILALLSKLKPAGQTNVSASLGQLASLIKHKSLVMIFSDLLTPAEPVFQSLYHLKHRGNDVILFQILDEAEALFPFQGMTEFHDEESEHRLVADATGVKSDYLEALAEFQGEYRDKCAQAAIDFIPLHTGMPFDRALIEYLEGRSRRF